MSDFSLSPKMIAVWCMAYFAIVAVHEFGHYLAGLVIGVPWRRMRIRLFTFPQHVALKDGDEWISPVQTARYVKLAEPLMPTTAAALVFVAGGFLLETASLLLWAVLRLPFYSAASRLALGMTLLYLIFDAAVFLRTRRAGMDFSAMCLISPLFGSLIVAVVIGLQFYIVTIS